MKHFQVIIGNRVNPETWANCASCTSSCQSACKTSATVGSSICHKKTHGEYRIRRLPAGKAQ